MSDLLNVMGATGGSSVELARIGKITTYEVQEMELDRLDSLVGSESFALGFATFTTGVFVSTVVSWISAATLTPVAVAVYVAVAITTFMLSAWHWISWARARRQRPKLLAMIKARSTIVATATTIATLGGDIVA